MDSVLLLLTERTTHRCDAGLLARGRLVDVEVFTPSVRAQHDQVPDPLGTHPDLHRGQGPGCRPRRDHELRAASPEVIAGGPQSSPPK